MLLTSPGTNPNTGIFPRGLLLAVHARMRAWRQPVPPPHATDGAQVAGSWAGLAQAAGQEAKVKDKVKDKELVVYLTRRWLRRSVTNERSLLRRVSELLRPSARLVVLNPGSGGNDSSLAAVRHVMRRARVIFGPHGTAWGNAFFAPLDSRRVTLLEFNYMRGRDCHVKLHHYVGGGSRFWTLEPLHEANVSEGDPAARAAALPGERPSDSRTRLNESRGSSLGTHARGSTIGLTRADALQYDMPMRVDEDSVLRILWHAGVIKKPA